MVDPSPPRHPADHKKTLRKAFREARAAHVAALPESLRALVLNRPPGPVTGMIPSDATVGLYHAVGSEAPTHGWARWLSENGHPIALPWFGERDAPMEFRLWDNPWNEDALLQGPWGALQPPEGDGPVVPQFLVVPLLAFTPSGRRLGQGGGHYDRWLDAHPDVPAIGLAWDCQIAEELPHEDHDRHLAAVVTPTRIYEGQM